MAKKIYTQNGYNADIDAGSEDLHPGGGDMFFAAAAATTTVVSSDAADDGNPVGTGARTVRVIGLDTNNRIKSEDVTMNGTTVVTLTTEFKRIWSVEVLTFGSGNANAGTIDVKHSSDVLCRMAIGANRSEHASFTAPSKYDFPLCHVKHVYGSLMNAPASGIIVFNVLTRKSGEPWKTRMKFAAYSTASVAVDLDCDIKLEPGEDVKVRATASANNSEVSAGLQIALGSYSAANGHT